MKDSFWTKYKDTRWQEKRLEVLQDHQFTCDECGSTKENTLLHAHHIYYERNKDPWDYPLNAFKCLCDDCHKSHHQLKLEIQKTFGRLCFSDMVVVLGFARGLLMQFIPVIEFPVESTEIAIGISLSLSDGTTPEEIIKSKEIIKLAEENELLDGFILQKLVLSHRTDATRK